MNIAIHYEKKIKVLKTRLNKSTSTDADVDLSVYKLHVF